MKRVVADIETDNLLDKLTVVHCLVLRDMDTNEVLSCADQPGYVPIAEGLRVLRDEVEAAYFHNGIRFDYPALRKVYPDWDMDQTKIKDTLVIAQMRWAHINKGNDDAKLPKHLKGRQSLEAWGYRLGVHKGEYTAWCKEQGITDVWAQWRPEMQKYCEGDTATTKALVEHIRKFGVQPGAVETELAVAWYLAAQEDNGVPFDVDSAVALQAKLAARRSEVERELVERFGSWLKMDKVFTPARDNKTKGVTKGIPYTKLKLVTFNPGSRQNIADRLTKLYGWKPTEFTDNGQPKVDEKTLKGLPNVPEVKLLMEYLLLDKRLGQIAEGKEAWLRHYRHDPRTGLFHIYGRVKQNGTVTHRAAHASPNLAQVPKVGKPHGADCRALFYVPPSAPDDPDGWVLVGADAASLEARCLAHELAPYPGGPEYGQLVLAGDVHTANQRALGLPMEPVTVSKIARDGSKTWYYAFMYGAGDLKLGSILVFLATEDGLRLMPVPKGGWTEKKIKALGAEKKRMFLENTPALKQLIEAVQQEAKQGWLRLADNRRVYVRSAHAALNSKLQGHGAVICKTWIAKYNPKLVAELGPQGWLGNWAALLWIHDEVQIAVRRKHAERVCQVLVETMRELTEHFKWRVPLDGEAKIGLNWKETH